MAEISVIIPVYQVEQYLKECLDSVVHQTFQDWEMICVNDGSPDNSSEILEEYASKDRRIKFISQDNLGLSGARNTGLDNATGRYIVFLDSDDKLPLYALKVLYSIAQITHAPVVASRHKKADDRTSGWLNYKVINKNVLATFIRDNKIHSSAWNKIYRADILKNHRFIQGIFFEDWPFLTTLMGQVNSFATTETSCYIYRDMGTSITRSCFSKEKVDSYLKGIHFVYDFYQSRADLRLAQKRIAIAAKMMINKVYKCSDKELKHYTKVELKKLVHEKILLWRDLPLKTLIRAFRLK